MLITLVLFFIFYLLERNVTVKEKSFNVNHAVYKILFIVYCYCVIMVIFSLCIVYLYNRNIITVSLHLYYLIIKMYVINYCLSKTELNIKILNGYN